MRAFLIAISLSMLMTMPTTAQTPAIAKICSAVVAGNWRNDLPVPQSWRRADCRAWAQQIGAQAGQLACRTGSGVFYEGQTSGWNVCGW